jgi:hypothetical protein
MSKPPKHNSCLFAFTTLLLLVSLACATVAQLFDATTINILADRGWQDTAVNIVQGQQVTIETVSGQWFEDPPGVWHDAGGNPNPWQCGLPTCHEPLPNFPKYALIGRVGDTSRILEIGLRLEFVAENSGQLYLRANYGDVDIPIHQPEGFVRVKITCHSPEK